MIKRNNKRHQSAVRKNALPKNRPALKLMLRGVLVGVVIAAGYGLSSAFEQLQLFPIKQVKIEGEFKYLTKANVSEELAEKTSGGFFDVDIMIIRDTLLKLQWIDDVFVRREWPDTLVIRIVEKQPLANWNQKGVLTANAELFYPAKAEQLDVVNLTGPEGRHAYILTEYNRLQSMLHQVDLKIENLHQNQRRSWLMTVDGIQVDLGRKDIEKKVENLISVYSGLIKPKIQQIEKIDFRYTNGFAVRWKQGAQENGGMEQKSKLKQANLKADSLMGAIEHV